MSLSGSLILKNPVGVEDIRIKVPGSYKSNDPNETPDIYYPAYNEALGLFAVLKTPTVDSWIYKGDPFTPFPICDDPLDYRRSFSFNSDDFKYSYNPATEPNLDKSRIYGALVLRLPGGLSGSAYFQNANFRGNITDDAGTAIFKEYITDFYPIESLYKASPYLEQETCYGEAYVDYFDQVEISLRLQNFYSFEENRYGKENTYWEILTYPIKTIDRQEASSYGLPSFNLTELPTNITINDTHYSSNTTIRAANNIYIEGNITTSAGVNVVFESGGSIVVKDPSALKPNITLSPKLDNIFGDEKIPPASNSYIKSFCAISGVYKANEVSSSLRQAILDEKEESKNDEVHLVIYPNPAAESFKVATNQKGNVSVQVYDLMGNLLYSGKAIGGIAINIPTVSFGTGIYLVKTTNATSTLTKRLIIE